MYRRDISPVTKSPYGYGVSRRNRPRPFIAKVRWHNRTVYLGSFYTARKAQAAVAYFLDNPPQHTALAQSS